MIYTIPLQDLGKDSTRSAGGKGTNLGEIVAAGLNVPPGFVLTTEAYDRFVQAHGLQLPILELASAVMAGDPESSQDAAAAIKKLFLSTDVPESIRADLDSAYAALTADGEPSVAVRSSTSAQDLPEVGFAGLHETYLNVQSEGALLIAVKYCWASLWTARALDHYLSRQIDPARLSLAAVVQRQIVAEASGLAFSLNPQNNCYDEAVIHSSFGLGTPVVSGRVTPDTFVVDKVTKEVLQTQISTKDLVLVALEGGGTQEQPPPAPAAASLSDAQATQVSELVSKVERHYGKPVSIEWALADGVPYLLQARPITNYVPLPDSMITEPGKKKFLYLDLIVLSQGFQESLSVLGNDIWGRMTETVKGNAGLVDRGMDGSVLNLEGRQYLHVSNLVKGIGRRAASRLLTGYGIPTRAIVESLDLEAYTPAKTPKPLRGLRWRSIRTTLRLLPHVIWGIRNPDRAVRKTQERFALDVQRSKQLASEEMPFGDLVGTLLGYLDDQTSQAVSLAAPTSLARRQLHKTFKKDNAGELLAALELDLPGDPTTEMGGRMLALARFPEVQETETGGAFATRLRTRDVSPEFMQALIEYMDEFGCRCTREIDIGTPRPYEDLPAFFEQLKVIDLERGESDRETGRRQEAYEQLLALATGKGQAAKFERQARVLENSGYRQTLEHFFVFSLDLMRRRTLALGKKLVTQGRLDRADQVFDLNVEQITQAQKDPTLSLLPLVEANLAPRIKYARVREWPRAIDSRGKILCAE